jgi:hypothetical protein
VRLAVIAAVACFGCTDLNDFRGSYAGVVVGGIDEDDPDCTDPAGCSFIRRGFPAGMTLDLTGFVPPPAEEAIGMLTSTGYDTGGTEAFADPVSRVRLMPVLEHDQLSLYDFPGAVRVRNYIFVAQSTAQGPLAGENVMVFVSLIDEDEIEVRLVAGERPREGMTTIPEHFGLFRMKRR